MLFTREFYRAIVYFCTKCRINRSDAIRGIREAFPMFDYTDKVIGDWFRNIKTLDDVISKKHQRSSRINDPLMGKIIFEVRKSPTISSRSIGKKVKASHSTVLLYLKKAGYSIRPCRIIPHLLTDRIRTQRILYAKLQIPILEAAQSVNFENIITGDETWIYYQTPPHYFWGKPTDEPPTVIRKQQHDKKTMLVMMVSGSGMIMKHLVPENKSVDGPLFCEKVLKSCAIAWNTLFQSKPTAEQQMLKDATAEGIRRAKQVLLSQPSLVSLQSDNISDSIMVYYKYSETEDDNDEDLHNTNDISVKYGHPRKSKEKATDMLNHLTAVLKPPDKLTNPSAEPGSCIIHYDNAPCHNSRICSEELSHTPFVRLPHPPYSPDIAVCDFYLFGKLKHSLQQVAVSNRRELEDEIDRIMMQISRDEWKRVFTEWLKRLRWIAGNNGEYYREDSGKTEEREKASKTECNTTASTGGFISAAPYETPRYEKTPIVGKISQTPPALSTVPASTPPSPNTSLPTSPLTTLPQTTVKNGSPSLLQPLLHQHFQPPKSPTPISMVRNPFQSALPFTFPLDTPLRSFPPLHFGGSSMQFPNNAAFPEMLHSSKSAAAAQTTEANLDISRGSSKTESSSLHTNTIEKAPAELPQLLKHGYYMEGELHNGKKI